MALENIEPALIWKHFSMINEVPRPSKKEGKMIEFIMNFGKSLNLFTAKDAVGNVIIKKPASKGMEDRKTVILQSHLDMVTQKNNDTDFDFDTMGIQSYIDGDWVKAKGTTLGADNGIGVATIMTILASDNVAHPAIEAMFTIDEETGMTGAMKLDPTNFTGTILLNLDSEDDRELSIGCAGGLDSTTSYNYHTEKLNGDYTLLRVEVKGLMGGHSGMDIHLGRGNSNKMLARILFYLTALNDMRLVEFDGGGLRNAIPREAVAKIAVPTNELAQAKAEIERMHKVFVDEYYTIEKDLKVVCVEEGKATEGITVEDTKKIIFTLHSVHNGVFRWSPVIENLVEASSNLARVIVKDGKFTAQALIRSSVESSKADVANTFRCAFENMGCGVVESGDYPGWEPNRDSAILKLMEKLYREKFNEEPNVMACHAGLECGILGEHFQEMDMISFGPTIIGAHSPEERVQISSVQKFWGYLQDVLKAIPKK